MEYVIKWNEYQEFLGIYLLDVHCIFLAAQ